MGLAIKSQEKKIEIKHHFRIMKSEGSWNRNSEFLIKNLPYKQENPKDLNKPWEMGNLGTKY